MDKLIINGPTKLSGAVNVSSAKNASLPIMAATLLFPGKMNFTDLPKLSDINFFLQILESLGATVNHQGSDVLIDCEKLNSTKADYELVRKMRASVLVLGPLLARFGRAEVSLPGGCAIGTRPVDIHLKGMEALGAKIEIANGYINATCEKLVAANIHLSFPSVGATENIMMAACLAEGTSVLENCACEPEIEDLANFLNSCGFDVQGAGTSTIKIYGKTLNDITTDKIVEYSIIGDRIEAATYIIAGLMCDSEITVTDFNPSHIEAVLDVLKTMGAKLERGVNFVKVFPSGKLSGAKIETGPHPAFPTDVQAQLMGLMGISNGYSIVSEKIFENRFMHVPELVRMGMNIDLDGNYAFIKGTDTVSAAPVMCTDLRASAALVLSALLVDGETTVNRIYHLDRGYEKIESKLQGLGANIKRVKGS
jgi:UDP-N-acetylglucosamine 1-carboxyvinyltransferase